MGMKTAWGLGCKVPTAIRGFWPGIATISGMVSVKDLIYDWNKEGDAFIPTRLEFDDETLRDGLQSPSVADPDVDKKIELLHVMDGLGIHTANLGLPGAGGKPREFIKTLAKEIVNSKLSIGANVACRTIISDIEPVVEISQESGMAIEVCAFIGSSHIRQYTEDWSLETMLGHTRSALNFARENNLPVMYVTEDTSRANPETLRALFTEAIELGAKRLCVCDTSGHSTPQGAAAVIRFVKSIVDELNPEVGIDWHGHRDRDLGIANSLAAIEAGATRVHGTALGIGERAGNTPMDLLLVNCKVNGWIDNDLTRLPEYIAKASAAVEVPIPSNYPVLGHDAFETGTGVHAAAVIKAFKKGDVELADAVYSGVPASMVGLEQRIEVGPMSGRSNVLWVLEKLGLEVDDAVVQRVLDAGKTSKRMLSHDEIRSAAAAK